MFARVEYARVLFSVPTRIGNKLTQTHTPFARESCAVVAWPPNTCSNTCTRTAALKRVFLRCRISHPLGALFARAPVRFDTSGINRAADRPARQWHALSTMWQGDHRAPRSVDNNTLRANAMNAFGEHDILQHRHRHHFIGHSE